MFIKKEQSSDNNHLEESYTKRKAKHESYGWAMFARCSFDKKENKLNYYKGKYCIEKLCKKLKERAMKIVHYEQKEMIPLLQKKKSPIKNKKNAIYEKKSFL